MYKYCVLMSIYFQCYSNKQLADLRVFQRALFFLFNGCFIGVTSIAISIYAHSMILNQYRLIMYNR